MAEKRMVPAALFEDDFFISITAQERYIWLGLIIKVADDQGRLSDNPRLIKSSIFPGDLINDSEIEKALIAFEKEKKILRYTSGNKNLVQIIDWWKEYQGSKFIQISKFDPPPMWTDREIVNCTSAEALNRKNECEERKVIKPTKENGSYRIERNAEKPGGFPAGFDPFQEKQSTFESRFESRYDKDNEIVVGMGGEKAKVKAKVKGNVNDDDDATTTSSSRYKNFLPDPGQNPNQNQKPDLKPASPESLPPKSAYLSYNLENIETAPPKLKGEIKYIIKRIYGQDIALSKNQLIALLNYFLRSGRWEFQGFLQECFKELPTAEFINLAIEKIKNNHAPMPDTGAKNENKR